MRNELAVYLILVNALAFFAFGADKRRARRGKWRISERMLLWLAFAGGGTGAWLGMQVFRHKTRKTKFRVLIPLSVLLWLVIIVWLAWTGGMV